MRFQGHGYNEKNVYMETDNYTLHIWLTHQEQRFNWFYHLSPSLATRTAKKGHDHRVADFELTTQIFDVYDCDDLNIIP